MERFSSEDLSGFARSVLVGAGMSSDDADIAAGVMVWNNLRGADGHGVRRLFQMIDRHDGGGLSFDVRWSPVEQRGGTTFLDAADGWGTIAGHRGMVAAMESARKVGVGVTVVRDCDVTSAMGYYPWVAAVEGFIGIAITNSVPLMPPWGGSVSLIGNQAFGIAVPTRRHPPLVLDTSSSAYNMGKMRSAAAAGEALPEGVALDSTGRPTADPEAALDALRLLPMGGHRGGGLALMWEVLTGILSGGRSTTEVTDMKHLDQTMGLSLYLQAIDPAAFMDLEEFRSRVDRLIDQVHANPPVAGGGPVRVPGEAKAAVAADRESNGIPIEAEEIERLEQLGSRFGVAWIT